MTKTRTRAKQRPAKARTLAPRDKIPLIEHIRELRRRLFYVAASVAVWSAIAYGFEHQILDILMRPSHGQEFIYTSPMGGMNFLFTICLDIGLVLSTPVIIYQILAFIQPLMRGTTHKFLLGASAVAGVVAICGVLFGYFAGLPSALHFLLNQFTTVQVRPLITIQSYIQFVGLYLLGAALMFQLPLIVLLINRIKPLTPSKLNKYQRHMIVAAFVIAFIMNPTPNIIDQLFVVIPIIISYQFSIALIWFMRRRQNSDGVALLREQDAQRQAERANLQLTPLTVPAPEFPKAAEIELPDTDTPVAPAITTAKTKVAETEKAVTPAAINEETEEKSSAQTIAVTSAEPKQSPDPAPEPSPKSPAKKIQVRTFSAPRRSYAPLRGQLVQ